jgi:hypothetical protein
MKAVRYIAGLALCTVLAGCAGQRAFHNEVQKIGTPTAYAKGLLEQHNVIGEQIVLLKNDPGVSEASKTTLVNLYRKSVCSAQERAAAVETAACSKGPTYTLDGAIIAYEALAGAQSEAEMQKAADALALLVADLLTAISHAR